MMGGMDENGSANGRMPGTDAPPEFSNFENLTRLLIKVPKSEIDKEREREKRRAQHNGPADHPPG